MFAAIPGILASNLFPSVWLNLSPDSGVTLTSGKVSAVDVGSGFSAIQTTDALRPTIASVNGFNVFRFNNSTLKIPALPLTTSCIFLVFKATSNGIILEHSQNATPNPGQYIYTDINNSIQFTRDNPDPTPDSFVLDNYSANWGADGARKVVCFRVGLNNIGVNSIQFYINSTTPITDLSVAGFPVVIDTLFIGGRNESSAFVTMDIAAMEVYEKLTDGQVAQRMNELITAYNSF